MHLAILTQCYPPEIGAPQKRLSESFSPEGKVYHLLAGAREFFAPTCSSAAAYCGDVAAT
jgi:hypothetical protein